MFERYTERARDVVVLAQEGARTCKHNYIGTEHLLLGLLAEAEGIAARVLASLDVTYERTHKRLIEITGEGDEAIQTQIPLTPRAKKVCELALREALALGHNYIGTEHILLGLTRENEGVAARILLDFDADSEKIRSEVIRVLQGSRGGRRAPAEPPTIEELTKAGDLMQSALSRLAEWAKTQNAPYEAHMAALEAAEGIEAWTAARRGTLRAA